MIAVLSKQETGGLSPGPLRGASGGYRQGFTASRLRSCMRIWWKGLTDASARCRRAAVEMQWKEITEMYRLIGRGCPPATPLMRSGQKRTLAELYSVPGRQL